MVAGFTEAEQMALFHDNAKRFYRLEARGIEAIRDSRAVRRDMERGLEARLEES